MRLTCHLGEHRGDRSLRSIAAEAGISAGQLSMIEAGRLLPRDNQIAQLEKVYELPVEAWYSERAKLAIQEDT